METQMAECSFAPVSSDPNLVLTGELAAGHPDAAMPSALDARCAGLLARPELPGWRTARFVNDLLDTTPAGAAVFGRSTNPRRLAAFAAIPAAVILLDGRTAAAGRKPFALASGRGENI